MKKITIILFFTVVSVFNGLAQGKAGQDTLNRIKKYHGSYESAVERYRQEFFNKKQHSCINYVKALKSRQKKMQSSGDLDGWAVINSELARFREKPVVREVDESHDFLKTIQLSYIKHIDKLESDKNEQIVKITRQYISELEGLKKKKTQAGEFADAFAYKAELEKVNNGDAYKAALKSVGRKPTDGHKNKTSGQRGDKPPKVTRSHDGSTIYPSGTRAPSGGISYKAIPLARTKQTPLPCPVMARLSVKVSKTKGSSSYSSVKERCSARVSLRALQSAGAFSDVTVVLQYYSRTNSSGLELLENKNVKLSKLEQAFAVIDFSTVSVRYMPNYRYSEGHRTIRRTNSRFYGYVVSVFDSDGKLIYQGSSKRQLGPIAGIPTP